MISGENMNIESEKSLKEFISTHNFNSYDGFYIKDLYKLFMDQNVTNIESFLSSPDDFCAFCLKNIDLFTNSSRQISKERIIYLISYYSKEIKNYISESKLNNHISYVNIVKDIAPFKFKTKLLDVGPGRIPYSSMLLAKDFENIKSLDSVYYPSVKTLKNLGIEAMLGFFTNNSSLENIDMVVGQAPCSAFEAIAEKCAETNTPYFLEGCGCTVPDYVNPLIDYECFGWEEVLPAIDPNISFHKQFIFNLNLPADEVKNIINKHIPPTIKFKPYPTKKQSLNNNFLQNTENLLDKTM